MIRTNAPGGVCCALVRIQMLEVRPANGKNRGLFWTAPEEMPPLRRQGGAPRQRAGDTIQGLRLLRYRLRRENGPHAWVPDTEDAARDRNAFERRQRGGYN